MDFTKTHLWSQAIGEPIAGSHQATLAVAYFKIWGNACELANRIQADLPNLTLHDEKHFESLWRRADQICGDHVSLSPLEVFVFGAAILLHDLGLTISAYKGGKKDLQQTPQWFDAAASIASDNSDVGKDKDTEQYILFETLRSLHAETAKNLAWLTLDGPNGEIPIIEDGELRSHLGQYIGQIAASHHWDLNKLQEQFPPIIGSISGYPESWTVRPILLACLLRCADAVQLDQSRAPDFVYALLKPTGLSQNHWRAQNKISAPILDPNDKSALLFSSTRAFGPEDAEAWWIIHDALQIANKELHGSNSLLRDLSLPPFSVCRISKCESPRMLCQSIRVTGWHPINARIHISDVDKVVGQFGGRQLYGDVPLVALRELIQNAADAIRLRRILEHANFEGKITVKVFKGAGKYELLIEDDGLGMSEAVLTGTLIDFGSSYIATSLVRIERPGLVGKRPRLTGKFGIGFFSVFMLGDKVDVASRPYDRGLNDTKVLRFVEGTKRQPLLIQEIPADYSMNTTTSIRVGLTHENFNRLCAISSNRYDQTIQLSLCELVAALTATLDVDVWVEINGEKAKVHEREYFRTPPLEWLRAALLLNNLEVSEQNKDKLVFIDRFWQLLEPVVPGNHSLGFAAISPGVACGVRTIGGLSALSGITRFADEYIGFIEYSPSGPSRGIGGAVAHKNLPDWASRQARKLASLELSSQERFIAAVRVSGFGGDATPIACMYLNRKFTEAQQIADKLVAGEDFYLPVAFRESEKLLELKKFRSQQIGFLDNYQDNEIEFMANVIEPIWETTYGPYLHIALMPKEEPCSFAEILSRLVSERGYQIQSSVEREKDLAIYVGLSSEREGLENGSLLECSCLKIWARQTQKMGE